MTNSVSCRRRFPTLMGRMSSSDLGITIPREVEIHWTISAGMGSSLPSHMAILRTIFSNCSITSPPYCPLARSSLSTAHPSPNTSAALPSLSLLVTQCLILVHSSSDPTVPILFISLGRESSVSLSMGSPAGNFIANLRALSSAPIYVPCALPVAISSSFLKSLMTFSSCLETAFQLPLLASLIMCDAENAAFSLALLPIPYCAPSSVTCGSIRISFTASRTPVCC